jgi:hypothetical protein
VTIRKWLRGLVGAAIASGANAITVMIVEPQHFNIHEGLDRVGWIALVSAIVGAALYLKEHPIPEECSEPQPEGPRTRTAVSSDPQGEGGGAADQREADHPERPMRRLRAVSRTATDDPSAHSEETT